MSQENVEIVRGLFDLWNAGKIDEGRESYDPGVILRPSEGWPEPGPYVGREATMDFFHQLRNMFDANAVVPIEFTDAGDRVVVTMRGGRIVFQEFLRDQAASLEAAGLSE